jgi:hypothetical protein
MGRAELGKCVSSVTTNSPTAHFRTGLPRVIGTSGQFATALSSTRPKKYLRSGRHICSASVSGASLKANLVQKNVDCTRFVAWHCHNILGNSEIPVGAYSLYVIPEEETWTLVVNKNVTAGSKYDEKQDLARAPMEIGQIDSPAKQPQILFGHTGAKQCNMRLYYETTGAWVEFKEE